MQFRAKRGIHIVSKPNGATPQGHEWLYGSLASLRDFRKKQLRVSVPPWWIFFKSHHYLVLKDQDSRARAENSIQCQP